MERFEELTKEIREKRRELKAILDKAIQEDIQKHKQAYEESYRIEIKPLEEERNRARTEYYYNKYYRRKTPKETTKRDRVANELFGMSYKDLDEKQKTKVQSRITTEYRRMLRGQNE